MKSSLLLLFPFLAFTQSFSDSRDHQQYEYVQLGSLYWMTENLRYNAEGSTCLSDCQTIRFFDYRYLKNVCPPGWRLPSVDEWDSFTNSFSEAQKVRMLEDNKKLYRVDFLDKFDIFESNILNIKAYGRIEGGRLERANSIDYWAFNPATDDRFHMHLTPFSITGHAHKHHLKTNKPDEFRLFPIRCVCDNLPDF